MNKEKTKKLAIAAAAMVMAGSMAFSITACQPKEPGLDDDGNGGTPGGTVAVSNDCVAKDNSYLFGNLQGGMSYVPKTSGEVVSYLASKGMTNFNTMMNDAWVKLYRYYIGDAETGGTAQGKLDVADSYGSNMTLRLNICDSGNVNRQITFLQGTLSATVQLLDGKEYGQNSLKPTWRALSEQLGMNFENAATGLSSDQQVTQNLDKLDTFDLVTASSDAIVTQALSNPETFLDLNLYLDEMPNYKAFLEANPITRLSLTSDASTGAMYYAPYFDGNDDIEKYELINKIWVSDLLDDAKEPSSNVTYKEHAESKAGGHSATNGYTQSLTPVSTKTAIVAYMGSEDWEIDVTKEDGVSTEKVYIKYSKALEAVKDDSTPLGAAYAEAAGTAYKGTSGNIVDIMNAAINERSGEVTGAELVNLLRAYIDVTYVDESGNKYYDTRSDVFNGQNAAWDVDLLAALSRCLVTNNDILTPDANGKAEMKNLYAIAGRTNTTQRNNDLISLAGELYGVRGLTPRYQYAYINGNGELVDARTKEATFDAVQNLHAFVEEGLLYLHDNINGTPSVYGENKAQTMMMYDYVQTQTKEGFEQDISEYNFAPIVTPVSNWDVNDDGTKDTIMRFTESWRSVKNTGFAIPKVNVENSPEKLAAVLAFIDYLFSNDGQMLMTFGPQASGADAVDGFWYANEADVQLSTVAEQVEGSDQYTIKDEYASQYFIYKNKVYTGTPYKGTQIPTLTNSTLQLFYGNDVKTANGNTINLDSASIDLDNTINNYTDFARGLIGAALPIGNKNQGFEYQCTAECGLDGAAIVGNGLANGTIKHPTVTVDEDNLWYTLVPTTLPYSNADATQIKTLYTDITTGLFGNGSKIYKNAYLDILYYGLGYMAS